MLCMIIGTSLAIVLAQVPREDRLLDRLLPLATFTVMCKPRLSFSHVPPPGGTTTGCLLPALWLPSPLARLVLSVVTAAMISSRVSWLLLLGGVRGTLCLFASSVSLFPDQRDWGAARPSSLAGPGDGLLFPGMAPGNRYSCNRSSSWLADAGTRLFFLF